MSEGFRRFTSTLGLDITFGTKHFLFSPQGASSYKNVLTHLVTKNLEQISFVDSLDSLGVQLSPHTCWQLGLFQTEVFSVVNAY